MYTKLSKQIQVFTDGKPQIVTITVNYSRTNIELISITVYQEWKHSNMAATETDITHMVEEFGVSDNFISKVNWSEVYADRKEKELVNQ